MKTNGDEPIQIESPEHFKFNSPSFGLTKREYMAIQILQGLCSFPVPVDGYQEHAMQDRACAAVEQADALIAELNKDQK